MALGHLKPTRRGGWDWNPLLAVEAESFWEVVCKFTALEIEIKSGLRSTK